MENFFSHLVISVHTTFKSLLKIYLFISAFVVPFIFFLSSSIPPFTIFCIMLDDNLTLTSLYCLTISFIKGGGLIQKEATNYFSLFPNKI